MGYSRCAGQAWATAGVQVGCRLHGVEVQAEGAGRHAGCQCSPMCPNRRAAARVGACPCAHAGRADLARGLGREEEEEGEAEDDPAAVAGKLPDGAGEGEGGGDFE